MRIWGVLLLVQLAACGGSSGPAAPAANYELRCDSADTTEQSTLFCVRADTRNGEVLVIDLPRIPVTSGSSRAADERAGTYQTECDSTVTPTKSDFGCVRLNTVTGDVVLLRLSELPRWPR